MSLILPSQKSTKLTCMFVCVTLVSTTLFAQSGSKTNSPQQSASQQTSNQRVSNPQTATKIGYSGHCPVCILDMKKWVKGAVEHQATYDSTVYYFPNAETKGKFMQSPEKYVPALGGDCTVCLAKMGKRVPGSVKHASLHGNRVFLFPEAKQKQMFDASPAEFANVDLAAQGNCVVCLAKMGKTMPGKPEFTAINNGMRYQFPADEQRQMFLRAPAEFISADSTTTVASNPVALEGYCTVCITMMKKWVKGSPEHSATYDGKKYLFPDAATKQKFAISPEKFVPAFGGDCVLCYAKMGKRVAGSIKHASLHEGRLYLFPSEKEKAMFDGSPADFVNIDLAAQGNCVVCMTKMGKTMPGKPEFTAIHNGFRYQFPADAQRQMFINSPAEFISQAAKPQGMGSGNKTSQMELKSDFQNVSIKGKTACAGCSYGVTPIGAPDELGLAVVDAAGKVFVIEDSHTNWPELYKARFDGKQVEVSGQIIKSEGNIAWVKPSNLSIH